MLHLLDSKLDSKFGAFERFGFGIRIPKKSNFWEAYSAPDYGHSLAGFKETRGVQAPLPNRERCLGWHSGTKLGNFFWWFMKWSDQCNSFYFRASLSVKQIVSNALSHSQHVIIHLLQLKVSVTLDRLWSFYSQISSLDTGSRILYFRMTLLGYYNLAIKIHKCPSFCHCQTSSTKSNSSTRYI